jgi:hypothetical protein
MRTNRTVQRKRQTNRLRTPRGVTAAPIATDIPVCVTCGEPLSRLPRYLGSQASAKHGFQCQRCFYANSSPAPAGSDVISSERARWLSDVLAAPGSPSSVPRGSQD